jgi:type VI secretion system protein ImpJ
VTETAHFWLLHTVNSCLPELKHIWSVRRGHPEPLYVTMSQLAGALSTFSLDAKARELPDYTHDDLGRCFRLLDEKIRNLLETVIPSKCVSVPLRLVDKSIWSGTVTNDEYLRNSQFFLAIGAKMGVDDLIKRVPQLVKVSPTDEMQNLIRLALPGVTLRHAPAPPSAITFKLDNQYFSLNQSGRLWEKITQSRNISLYVPSEIVDPKLELLVVLQ